MPHLFNSLVLGLLVLSFAGCTTLPKSFVADGNVLVHKPTGVRYPKEIKDWSLRKGSTDKMDGEIAVKASYERFAFWKAFNSNFMPFATVYVLNSKRVDGVKLMENQLKIHSGYAVFERKQKIKTEVGILTALVYGHSADVSVSPLVVKANNTESWLIRYPNQALAFWITIDKDQADELTAPVDFVNRFAEAVGETKTAVK